MNYKDYVLKFLEEATKESIRKYYPTLTDLEFNSIIDSAPQGYVNSVDDNSRLVLDLYLKDKFDFNDKEIVKDIYKNFESVKKKKDNLLGTKYEDYKEVIKIGSVKLLAEISNFLEFGSSGNLKLNKRETNIAKENTLKLFENDRWLVIVPESYESAVYWGKRLKASWCTSSSKAITHFNRYVALDDLYIFIDKSAGEDGNKAYQYHSRVGMTSTPEFNTCRNYPYSLSEFKKQNPDLLEVFNTIESESEKIKKDSNYKWERLKNRYIKSHSPYIMIMVIRDGNINRIKEFEDIYLYPQYKPILISDENENNETDINKMKFTTMDKIKNVPKFEDSEQYQEAFNKIKKLIDDNVIIDTDGNTLWFIMHKEMNKFNEIYQTDKYDFYKTYYIKNILEIVPHDETIIGGLTFIHRPLKENEYVIYPFSLEKRGYAEILSPDFLSKKEISFIVNEYILDYYDRMGLDSLINRFVEMKTKYPDYNIVPSTTSDGLDNWMEFDVDLFLISNIPDKINIKFKLNMNSFEYSTKISGWGIFNDEELAVKN